MSRKRKYPFDEDDEAFGQASTAGTGHVKYSPVVATDLIKAHCITYMKEYKNKSLEELRLEDYTAGRNGTPLEGGFAAQTQEARSSHSGSSGASAPGTAHVKYSPVMAIEVVEQGENSRNINIKAHCITHMKPIKASSQPRLAGQQPAMGNSECTICFDNPIDSALCDCGHMCMCHSCAIKQWGGRGNGQCPICRAKIIKVLRLPIQALI